MSGVHLRPAQRSDAPACAAILGDWIENTAWMPRLHTRAEDRAFLSGVIDRMPVLIAMADGAVAGFLARDGTEIDHLYLRSDARGRGIGTALMDRAQGAVDRLTLWCFQANRAARAFYTARGFREIDRTDGACNAEGLPDVRYLWERGR